MMHNSVLLDTSFFIRLLNDEDPLHLNAKGYFKYFLENEIILKVSTITIAEYCVKGTLEDLPLKNIQIMPFNLDQAQRTGEFARIIFNESKSIEEKITPRAIIPNDSKLFSQADLDDTITHFVTSDSRSKKTYSILKRSTQTRFDIMDISIPYHQTFGILDL
jgi:predicted nucleic acid-binding protein